MKEILVLSGKGGTGKTSFTAALRSLLIEKGKKVLAVDTDVEGSDLALLNETKVLQKQEFYSGYFAQIDNSKCSSCGSCVDLCRFDSISMEDGHVYLHQDTCEGCGVCAYVCPSGAIEMKPYLSGDIVFAKNQDCDLVYTELKPGGENSGKLVSELRRQAKILARKNERDFILLDGPPGIGCPVIAAAGGVDRVIVVAEPSLAGLADMERLLLLLKKLEVRAGIVINKAGVNPEVEEKILSVASQAGLIHFGNISWNDEFRIANRKGLDMIAQGDKVFREELERVVEFF